MQNQHCTKEFLAIHLCCVVSNAAVPKRSVQKCYLLKRPQVECNVQSPGALGTKCSCLYQSKDQKMLWLNSPTQMLASVVRVLCWWQQRQWRQEGLMAAPAGASGLGRVCFRVSLPVWRGWDADGPFCSCGVVCVCECGGGYHRTKACFIRLALCTSSKG